MAVVAGRTRNQILTSVLHNLGGVREITAQGNGSTTTFKINLGLAAADDFKGQVIKFLTGANTSGSAIITASSTPSSGVVTLTFSPAVTSTTTNDTALLINWQDPIVTINRINDFINQAVMETYGYFFDPTESFALHTDNKSVRYDIPTDVAMITRIDYRVAVDGEVLHDCDRTFDETTNSDFTQAVDTENGRRASALKLTVAVGADAGEFITDGISSVDISRYTHLEGWFRSTAALSAADYKIHLDNGTVLADDSDLESVNVPASTTTDAWQYFRVALATPERLTAIVSIGIEMDVDKGAHTIWFDDLKVTRQDSDEWAPLDSYAWWIDKEARDLILRDRRIPGYALLKLVGGDKPALFTADSSTSEVPEEYVVARATALSLLGGVSAPSLDAAMRGRLADYWIQHAETARRGLPMAQGMRLVD